MAVWKIKERYELSRANDNRPNRAIEMSGFEPAHTKNGSSILMASSSNSTDFGDLTNNRTLFGGMTASNQTRALYYGGEVPGANSTDIDSIQLATEGNASDHGDLTQSRGYAAATSNGIRAMCAGGTAGPAVNTIDFGSIAQTGNFADFGDLAESRNAVVGICSPTRAIFAGGTDGTSPSPAYTTRIDFVTINSTGNASDFGDLTGNSGYMSACQNKTKAFFIGGATGGNSSKNNVATDVITMATTGNAQEFGNLTQMTRMGASATDGRSGFTLGGANPSYNNVIQRFDMSSLGNMVDYSDLNVSKGDNKGGCGSHDGIDFDGIHPQRPSVTYMPGAGRIISNGGNAPDGGQMEFITISTLGNGVDFGDSAGGNTRAYCGATGNATRVMFMGGDTPSKTDLVDAVETASRGNSFDFGNLTAAKGTSQGCASTTRAINAGGVDPSAYFNVIEYAAFATAGNFADFGDLSATTGGPAGASSPTRGLFMGGYTPSADNKIDYITIASTGNATDFGNLTTTIVYAAGGASSTRVLRMGGATVNVIDYVTTASTGNATDFGDLTQARGSLGGGSSNTRSIAIGGAAPSESNVMDFVTIASTGNASDFGDMVAAKGYFSAASDAHGGLQG